MNNGFDMNRLMAQAQAMQNKLTKVQQQLESTIYEGKSNGLVVKVNGKDEVQSVEIPEEMMDDREMLQDVIMIAFNNAVKAASDDREDQLGSATGGLNIPGM